MGLIQKLATVVLLAMLGALTGVTAARAGGGGHCEPTDGRGTTVELSGACFSATTSFVEPGETVTFVNRDPYFHNVSGSGWGHYEDMAEGDTYSTSFTDQGVFAFACTLHPGYDGLDRRRRRQFLADGSVRRASRSVSRANPERRRMAARRRGRHADRCRSGCRPRRAAEKPSDLVRPVFIEFFNG